MKVKQVLVSFELIEELFMAGATWGDKEIVTCQEGLPAGAKLIHVGMRNANTAYLLFQHDSFDEIEYELYYDTKSIPVIKPMYSMRLVEAIYVNQL